MTKGEYESRIQTLCLAIITMVTLAVALYLLRIVVVPFILSAFLSLLLLPLVNFLMRKLRIGRPIALLLTLFLGFLALLGVGTFVSISVGQFANSAPDYERQLSRLIAKAENTLPIERIVSLISGRNLPQAPTTPVAPVGQFEPLDLPFPDLNEVAPPSLAPAPGLPLHRDGRFDATLLLPEGAMKGIARKFSSAVLSVLSNGLLVMLFTAFLLTGTTTRTVQDTHHRGVIGEIESRVQKYIIIKLISSMVTGFLVYLVLHLLGVRFALSFGTFAFILNFIPNLGSIVATLLPLPVVLLTPGVTWVTVVLALVLPTMIQFSVGSVVEPKVMGDTLGLHPVVVLMSLIFWGMLWGFTGLLLAVPMTAIAKIILQRIEITQPVAAVLEGRLDALEEFNEPAGKTAAQ